MMKKSFFPFSFPHGHRWGWFLVVVFLQLAALGYVGWRWHNITVDGLPYQWSCRPRLEIAAFGTDYVRVVFPEDTTTWQGTENPKEGQPVYIAISRDDQGILQVNGAYPTVPEDSDYMEATVVNYRSDDASVQFRTSFDRYRLAPEFADGIYQLKDTDKIMAKIRIKRGRGVIEGIFVNGMPLESLSNVAAMDKERAATRPELERHHLVDAGMVPPKEE